MSNDSKRLYIPPHINPNFHIQLPQSVVSTRLGTDFSNLKQKIQYSNGEWEIKRTRSIAIIIDGACINNGRYNARASVGVSFGPRSRYNFSQELISSSTNPKTSQQAEIISAILALNKVKKLVKNNDLYTKQVVLISDSGYLVKGITEWISRWRRNEWCRIDGGIVVNASLFRVLDNILDELRDKYEVVVKFWKVPRSCTVAADRLAERVLCE